jgi:hypothetical protein
VAGTAARVVQYICIFADFRPFRLKSNHTWRPSTRSAIEAKSKLPASDSLHSF